MTVETKYKIYDRIFFLNDNKKVVNSTIRGIKIHVTSCPIEIAEQITYLCNEESDARVHIKVKQEDAYLSKEELLQSL